MSDVMVSLFYLSRCDLLELMIEFSFYRL